MSIMQGFLASCLVPQPPCLDGSLFLWQLRCMHHAWLPGGCIPVVREGVAALADNARGACIWRLFDLQLVLLLPPLHVIILHRQPFMLRSLGHASPLEMVQD